MDSFLDEGLTSLNLQSIREPSLLQAVINAVPTPIFFKDDQGIYLGCNRAFEEFVGKSREELVGKGVFELWEKSLAQVYYDADAALYAKGGEQEYEAQVTYADGSVHDVIFHKAVFHTEDGDSGIVGAMLDITARKQYERQLEELARTDPLTGVANRHKLYEELERYLKRANRNHKSLAVLAIDLDDFKGVNDQYGHHVGDAVLKECAQRFIASTRQTDLIARLGGDEFIIVLEDVASVEMVNQIAIKILETFEVPVDVDGLMLPTHVSIGVAFESNGDVDPDHILLRADKALYKAKASGKNRFSH